jgi:hypothetical protein
MSFSKLITPSMKAALLECFLSATRLLPLRLRPSFILIGSAAAVFHGSTRYTEDVDVAATSEAILCFYGAIASGTTQFKHKSFVANDRIPLQPRLHRRP